MDNLKLGVAAALVGLGLVAWLALARRGPERTALATILSKGSVAATSIYVQQPVDANGNAATHTEIPIPESNTFELRVDGVARPVRASFNTVKSRQFDVGQRVRVRFVRRGLTPIWSRLVVVDMMPVDSA